LDLIIEGQPAELEWLRKEIDRDLGTEAQLEAVPSQDSEELNEPLLVAVIVALGGPAIVRSVKGVLERRYQHLEEIRRLDLLLRLDDGRGGERWITEADLERIAADVA
jgi:hypothetical protein